MSSDIKTPIYDLSIFIVKFGMGSKIISLAKKLGISGGTVLLGKGTIRNSLLRFLEFDEASKEVVLILSKRSKIDIFLKKAYLDFRFIEQNKGICFSIPVTGIIGARSKCNIKIEDSLENTILEESEMIKYNSIFAIVDKGKSDIVVDTATEAGARGATIINARGSGIHETAKVFAIEIEPEKELILMLVEEHLTETICEKISEKAKMEEAGNGILFVQEVNKAYGLYKK